MRGSRRVEKNCKMETGRSIAIQTEVQDANRMERPQQELPTFTISPLPLKVRCLYSYDVVELVPFSIQILRTTTLENWQEQRKSSAKKEKSFSCSGLK